MNRTASIAAIVGVGAVIAGSIGAWTTSSAAQSEPASASIRSEFSEAEIRRILQHSPLSPLPANSGGGTDERRTARLGQFLFFDTRLSGDGSLSCATCHDPQLGFADGKALAVGAGQGTRHTPSLWNVGYNRWYFWDGRADSLWSQALHPIERDIELAGSRLHAARLLHDDPALRKAYEGAFGPMPDLRDRARFPDHGGPAATEAGQREAWEQMTEADRLTVNRIFVNIGKAIGSYERQIISDSSPFDAFVSGLRSGDDERLQALDPAARRGLKLFIGRGECRLCHSGPNFTDGEFHDIGVPGRGGVGPKDPGRFDGIAQLRSDPFNAAGAFSEDREGPAAQQLEFLAEGPQTLGQLKTPSLRNVAATAPYMHQGQFSSLKQVLEYYSTLQGSTFSDHHRETVLRPREFSREEMDDLIAFLQSLTDVDLDPALMQKPDSPLIPE